MTKQVQFRKGTTAEHFNFTGALAEITVAVSYTHLTLPTKA